MNNIELLREYKQLLDDNIITQEEFEKKRDQLLNEQDGLVKEPSGDSKTEVLKQDAAKPASQVQSTQQSVASDSSSSTGWAVLGFLIPLVGLILYLVWNTSRPADAKAAGKGALIGTIVCVFCYMLVMCSAASSYY